MPETFDTVSTWPQSSYEPLTDELSGVLETDTFGTELSDFDSVWAGSDWGDENDLPPDYYI